MASVTVIFGPYARDQLTVKVTPATPMREVLDAVCTKLNRDPHACALQYRKRTIDLSVAFRLANLPSGAKLDLVENATGGAEALINVALQLDDGRRIVDRVPTTSTLWALLERFGAKASPDHALAFAPTDAAAPQPVCIVANREIAAEALRATTLNALGLVSGSAVIRLRLRAPDGSIVAAPSSAPEPSATLPPAQAAASVETAAATAAAAPMEVDRVPQDGAGAAPDTVAGPVDAAVPAVPAVPAVSAAATSAPVPRDARVYLPATASADPEQAALPDSFYEVDESFARQLMASYRRSSQLANAPLEAKAIREAEARKQLERHPTTLVRVRFPDRLLLQGQFGSTETAAALYAFVAEHLAEGQHDFELFTAPPRQVVGATDPRTLFELGLCPAAMVNLSWRSAPAALHPDLLSTATEIPLVAAAAPIASDDAPLETADAAGPAPAATEANSGPVIAGAHRDPPKPKWLKLGPKS